jgi:MFS family permease
MNSPAPASGAPPAGLPAHFSRLVGSNLAAQSAEQLSLAAVPMVAVLALGAGAGEIGLIGMVQTLPFLLLSIPFGLLADRTSRRRLMVAAESLRAISLLGLLVATLLGALSVPVLALLGFVGAVGTVGFSVAAPALVPALVPREALAGALVSWAGGSTAFVLATILSAMAVVLLAGLPEPARSPLPPRHPLAELRDGARLAWRHPLLKPILTTSIVWNIAWFVLQAAYVPYAVRVLGLSASAVGLTLAMYGAGMVVGALLAQRVMGAMSYGAVVILGPMVSVAAICTMAATLWWPVAGLAALSYFLFGVGPIIWTISSTTLRQTLTPGPMLGRVSAIFLTVNAGARPIGAALGGLIGVRWGEEACLLVAVAGFALQAVVIAVSPIRHLQTLPPAAD